MAAAIRFIKNGNVFSKSNLYVIGFLKPMVTSLCTLSLLPSLFKRVIEKGTSILCCCNLLSNAK